MSGGKFNPGLLLLLALGVLPSSAADFKVNEGGTLVVRSAGSVTASDGDIVVEDGGCLRLFDGSLNARFLTVNSGGAVKGCGTIDATVVNFGLVLNDCDPGVPFTVVGPVSNHSLWRIITSTDLAQTGLFTNEVEGILDLGEGGSGPSTLVNLGLVVPQGQVFELLSLVPIGNDIEVKVSSKTGFTYQLQHSETMATGTWVVEGAVCSGGQTNGHEATNVGSKRSDVILVNR